MGSKKRNSDTQEKTGVEVEKGANNDTPKPLKKKAKKDKKKVGEEETAEGSATPSTTPTAVKPMERKKKRKAMDKVRRRAAAETEGGKPIQTSGDLKTDLKTQASSMASTSTSGVLPEFHIGVFKDLALADESLRKAAAKRLVMELQEVQNSYDRLEKKEVVEVGFKLEAEKDDGLDNCAPSVRYAIRRLIRGVSSSREVCVLLGT